MTKVYKMYLDDNNNEVQEEQATRLNIVEYDDNGNRIQEIYMVKDNGDDENAKEYWDNSFKEGRQSIPYEAFKKRAYLIEESYLPRLKYLKVVDNVYFKE